MSEKITYPTPEAYLGDYKSPRCIPIRTYDDSCFKNKHSLYLCEVIINKKTKEKCGVPRYCHPSLPHPLCKLTQEMLLKNKFINLTYNKLCVTCLEFNICSPFSSHPISDTSNMQFNSNNFFNKLNNILSNIYQPSIVINKPTSNEFVYSSVSNVYITYWDNLEGYDFPFYFPRTREEKLIFFNEFMKEISERFYHILENSKFNLFYVPSDSELYLENRKIIKEPSVLVSVLRQIVSLPIGVNKPYLLYVFKEEEEVNENTISPILWPKKIIDNPISDSLQTNSLSINLLECKERYKYTCLVCEIITEDIEVSHLLDFEIFEKLKIEEKDNLLNSNGLNQIHGPNNLICLCKNCKKLFDENELCLKYYNNGYYLVIKESIFENFILSGKYQGN